MKETKVMEGMIGRLRGSAASFLHTFIYISFIPFISFISFIKII